MSGLLATGTLVAPPTRRARVAAFWRRIAPERETSMRALRLALVVAFQLTLLFLEMARVLFKVLLFVWVVSALAMGVIFSAIYSAGDGSRRRGW